MLINVHQSFKKSWCDFSIPADYWMISQYTKTDNKQYKHDNASICKRI